MGRFVNRNDEFSFLDEEYKKDTSSLVVLYGRRRIGKTALTAEFGRDKNILYFLASEESERENLNVFKNLVADFSK